MLEPLVNDRYLRTHDGRWMDIATGIVAQAPDSARRGDLS
jgi:hypothetical protein